MWASVAFLSPTPHGHVTLCSQEDSSGPPESQYPWLTEKGLPSSEQIFPHFLHNHPYNPQPLASLMSLCILEWTLEWEGQALTERTDKWRENPLW